MTDVKNAWTRRVVEVAARHRMAAIMSLLGCGTAPWRTASHFPSSQQRGPDFQIPPPRFQTPARTLSASTSGVRRCLLLHPAAPSGPQQTLSQIRIWGSRIRSAQRLYCAVHPPSITMSVPVMKPEASELRNTARAPSSSSLPQRPKGILAVNSAICAGSSSTTRVISVGKGPGLMALAVMLYGANSSARALVMPSTANLLAL